MTAPSAKPHVKLPTRWASAHILADSAEHAYRALDSHSIDAVLLDSRVRDAAGMETLLAIKRHRPDVVVIVVTGYGTVQSAVQAMKNGAYTTSRNPSAWKNCVCCWSASAAICA